MKPVEGRKRIVIEEVQPQVNGGRYPAKRILGDQIEVTCAAFGDGHDHVAGRLLYRKQGERRWRSSPLRAGDNDLWRGSFTVDQLGAWEYTLEAWIDHFDTWADDLAKRLGAQPDPQEPLGASQSQDIPLALRSGALLLEKTALRAKGSDRKHLTEIVASLRWLADQNAAFYENPITEEIRQLDARYPDLTLATRYHAELPLWVDRELARFSSWYELFPRSASPDGDRHGTLNDVRARLPEIAAMGFNVLYMPPIHPIGLAYRKGPNNSVTAQPGDHGSPWAIGASDGGHKAIHAELGSMEDFAALAAASATFGIELALDIAFQCSPDHPWVTEHPDWFIIRPDGSIQYAENPPKKYQDIYPLNFESLDWRGLWEELHSVFAFWIDKGVTVFRVDNPHTKALPFWEWCIAEIHKTHPEVIFLAEAFTRPHVMYSLAKAGFTQSYTYFTWRTEKEELQTYFDEITKPPVTDFFHPNIWPNTPDILHESLQTGGRPAFMQRLILSATLGANYGIYGPAFELCEGRPAPPSAGKTGSEEYLDSEKYQLRTWRRDDPQSLVPLITRINRIRRDNRALQSDGSLHFHPVDNPQIMAYSKREGKNVILVAINLDPRTEQSGWIDLDLEHLGITAAEGVTTPFGVEDLLTGDGYTWQGSRNYVALRPEVLPAHVFRIVPVSPDVSAEELRARP